MWEYVRRSLLGNADGFRRRHTHEAFNGKSKTTLPGLLREALAYAVLGNLEAATHSMGTFMSMLGRAVAETVPPAISAYRIRSAKAPSAESNPKPETQGSDWWQRFKGAVGEANQSAAKWADQSRRKSGK